MSHQLPSPEFDPHPYHRPNQNWLCGRAGEGDPCRMGPTAVGRCRGGFECQPLLKVKPGETKGRYYCTRPTEQGGPCASGPRPNGACALPILRCTPRRSLRCQRGLLSRLVVIGTLALLLIGFCGPFRASFINPGPLSIQHSARAFELAAGALKQEDNCTACHQPFDGGLPRWLTAAFQSSPGPIQFAALAAIGAPSTSALDQKCQTCHPGHVFHEPNVSRDHSCSACHREHRGQAALLRPTDANCISCHASSREMATAAEKGQLLPASAFDNIHPGSGRVVFRAPRPRRGYTHLIHSFATDHPEFQVLADHLKDPNPLKFNHQLHLTSRSVPAVNGQKLVCSNCHKPEASGNFHLKISFEDHCRACHSLQFDLTAPNLRLPHGSSAQLRAFLRSLPEHYAQYAARQKGITDKPRVDAYVQEQISRLRQIYGSGEELERRIFWSDARTGPVARVGLQDGFGAARFPGCASCHEVREGPDGRAQVASPQIPDRWLIRGSFNHARHLHVACTTCHAVTRSRDTSDILLPSKQACVLCHSPQGGVASDCSTCHAYHSHSMEALP